ncbi:exonuclease 1 isoform X2 [Quercus robur]|uniref:exonuclease 1 isoform X2 n=1 Tax=Quercus robur TaxID=38942 RepID=UPI002161AD8C|nr:exonuclease 1 isoform X2 [Quercus robur]
MGIQGLLPLLKSIMVPTHIKELQGCSVAVDTYSWLHKGALSCSRDLCKGLPTTRHIEYCMHRVNLLRHNGVKPILVFDGGLLPMKGEQENKRGRVRKENLSRAIEHESQGNSAAAYECYQKAVDISPLIACELIQENVSYVVAPYEADAQMTFLAVSKQVEAVITEDSDLIPFGCPRIIFKMDKFGQGVEFQHSMLQQNKEISFAGFTKQMLLEMCILSGCDYLQSLPGMGLKRAYALIKKFKSYDKVIKHLRYSTVSIPPSYEESFRKAILTFQHQRVYDPINEDIVHLSDISDNIGDDLDFLGPLISQQTAKGIAKGDLDPFTKMPFQVENVSSDLVLDRTPQLKQFNPDSLRKKIELPVQKNLLTKYFCFASLEAKRKFRAPRMSPNHPIPEDHSSLSPKEYINVEAAECKMNCLPASLLESKSTGTVPLANNPVEDDLAYEIPEFPAGERSPEHTLVQQPQYSIHKPCTAMHKERECKTIPHPAEGTETGNVVGRSSYFLLKSENQKDLTNNQEKVKANGFSNEYENTVPHPAEGKTRTETGKVVVKSSYFQQKSENQKDPNNNQEKVKANGISNVYENTIPENDSFRDNHLKDKVLKRKISPNDCVEKENVQSKLKHVDSALPDTGYCASNFDRTSIETEATEEKFGSNISHLSHYSEISEKSMEKFVSVITSFRCSSSGSRASGLRAPLKDVQNSCTTRPTIAVDFSQFAYVPNKQRKTALASRRG